MSLRGKDFRGEIDPDLHDKLRKMAEFQNVDVSALGSKLLEKAICGEWYEIEVMIGRLARIDKKGG